MGALQRVHRDTVVVTQNIDGLHQRGDATHVIELHGSIWRVRCACPDSPRAQREVPLGNRRCPHCQTWRRPDITWFEDPMDPVPIERAMRTLARCELLLSIGTSGVVYPAAALPRLATERGARCIEVNPETTSVSGCYRR